MVLRRDGCESAREHLRSGVRVDIYVPVVFEWKDRRSGSGERRHAEGVTLNMSPEGLYVIADDGPLTQVVARCRLALPPLIATREIKRQQIDIHESIKVDRGIHNVNEAAGGYEAVVIGRVIRREAIGKQQIGFAVKTRVMILREFDRSLIQ